MFDSKVLLDGDFLCYRQSYAHQQEWEKCLSSTDRIPWLRPSSLKSIFFTPIVAYCSADLLGGSVAEFCVAPLSSFWSETRSLKISGSATFIRLFGGIDY